MWALLGDFIPFTWNVTLLEDLTMTIRSILIQKNLSTLIHLLESSSRTWAITQYNLLYKLDLFSNSLIYHWHSYSLSPSFPLLLGFPSIKHPLILQALLAYAVSKISIKSLLPSYVNSCNTYLSSQDSPHSHILLG